MILSRVNVNLKVIFSIHILALILCLGYLYRKCDLNEYQIFRTEHKCDNSIQMRQVPESKNITITQEYDPDRTQSLNRVVNRPLTDYRPDLEKRFQRTIDEELSATHQDVISLVTDMIDHPSKHLRKNSKTVVHTPQSKYMMDNIYPEKREGFFVECGALDGERSSNTLWIEQKMNWTGLLIEADPYFYTQLLGKNRNAWSINACLSPSNKTQWLSFREDVSGRGKVIAGGYTKPKLRKNVRRVPCFPLQSMLLALNRTEVDFFSLDVEGLEIEILNSIPHKHLQIKSWTIEYDKVGLQKLQTLMEKFGYKKKEKIRFTDTKIHMYTSDLFFTI